jgi:hypothetical protein
MFASRVGLHLGPANYDLSALRAGRGRLNEIEETELGDVPLHLADGHPAAYALQDRGNRRARKLDCACNLKATAS